MLEMPQLAYKTYIDNLRFAATNPSGAQMFWNLVFNLPFQDIFSNLGDPATAQLVTSIIKLVSYFLKITQDDSVVSWLITSVGTIEPGIRTIGRLSTNIERSNPVLTIGFQKVWQLAPVFLLLLFLN